MHSKAPLAPGQGQPVPVANDLGLGSPTYRGRVLARLMGGIEVDRRSGCWMWQRSSDVHGNGTVFFRGRPRRAHWVAYVLLVAPAAAGAEVDHLCHTRGCRGVCRHLRCVNPRHLAAA